MNPSAYPPINFQKPNSRKQNFPKPMILPIQILSALSKMPAPPFLPAQIPSALSKMPAPPQFLPEQAKLQMSQIRPIGALPLEGHEPLYSGYSFLEDGRYAAGVWLCSEKEAMDYVEMQKPYQHKVMLCDRDDFCVMEVVDGEMVFPDEETLRKLQGQADGGSMELT